MKLNKLKKLLEPELLSNLESLDLSQLKDQITLSLANIKLAIDELEANSEYQNLKESLKAITAGLKELKIRQNAIIQYCLYLIEDKGHE